MFPHIVPLHACLFCNKNFSRKLFFLILNLKLRHVSMFFSFKPPPPLKQKRQSISNSHPSHRLLLLPALCRQQRAHSESTVVPEVTKLDRMMLGNRGHPTRAPSLVINGVMGKWPKIIGFHWVLFHLYKWNCIILTCNCFFFGPTLVRKRGTDSQGRNLKSWAPRKICRNMLLVHFYWWRHNWKGVDLWRVLCLMPRFFSFPELLSLTLYSNRCCIRTTYSYL